MPSFEVFETLLSRKSKWAGWVVTSTEVLDSSYPTARTLIAYLPGSSLSRGKAYWPCALLTTQVVMVEFNLLAPTITPSIAPSACEVIVPVSAKEDGLSAITRGEKARASMVKPTLGNLANVDLVMANLP